MNDSKRIAIIGLGSMGMGIARAMLRAGHTVSGCDVNADALRTFSASGGKAYSTPKKAVEDADIVTIVVVNAAQTETVLYGPDGAVNAMSPRSVIISSATIAPKEAKSFAGRAAELNLLYLDAPISGGAQKAEVGKLTVMASGPKEAFDAAKPALDAFAETVYTLGDDVGIGSSFKIVNQLLAGVHIAAACEAIAFAKSLDLDITKVFEVISKSAGNSWMFENRIPHVLAGDYAPRSAVSIFTKDLGIVSDLGRQQKFPLPIASAALQLFVMAEAAGMGADDDSSIARFLAQIAGLKLPGTD